MRAGRLLKDVIFFAAAVIIGAWLLAFGTGKFYRAAYPVKYSEAVEAGSKANYLPPSLVYAVIRTESGFNPDALSSVDAAGLMQIRKDTLDWVLQRHGEEKKPFETLFDGEENIKYGTALLRLLINEFGTIENALCAYHAGWGRATEWLSKPEYSPDGKNIVNIPFGDTKRYVKKVLETKEMYERLYG